MSIGSFVSGLLGGTNDFHAGTYQADPNAFKYGGPTSANGQSNQPYQDAQKSAMGMMTQQAQGQDFGVVDAQAAKGLAAQQAAAAGQAASARGGGAALAAAQTQAANTSAAMGADVANQSIQTKGQLQSQAIQNLGGLASQGLGQQMGWNQGQAQLGQNAANAQLQALENEQQLNANDFNAAQTINANVASGNASAAAAGGMTALGAGASAAGALASASDPRGKMSIAPEGAGSSFAMGAPPPAIIVAPEGTNPRDNAVIPSGTTAGGYMVRGDDGAIQLVPVAETKIKDTSKPSASAMGSEPSAQGARSNYDAGKSFGDSMTSLGKSLGNLVVSSPPSAKTSIAPEGGAKPGGGDYFSPATYVMSGGDPRGEAALAARDAHTANFAQMGEGMGNWFNKSNAAPWTPEASAADANLSHFMGMQSGNAGMPKGTMITSDTRAKKDAVREDALRDAANAMAADVAGKRNGFEWMRTEPTAVDPIKQPGDDLAPNEDSALFQGTDGQVFRAYRSAPAPLMDARQALIERSLANAKSGTDARQALIERSLVGGKAGSPDVISGGTSDIGTVIPVRPGGTTAVDQQMDVQHPYSFLYKDPNENGGARRHGVMTTDVKQGPAGPDLVKQGPKGEVISIPSATSALMAQTGRLHERQNATEQKLATLMGEQPQEAVMPAGQVNLSPTLATEQPAVYSVYDNGTKLANLTSDPKAKADAHAEGIAKGVALAQGYAPNPQDVRIIKHASSNPEMDEAWRAAITAPSGVESRVDLPAPPPPPMPDPQADRVARQLAEYNRKSDEALRMAAQGRPVAPMMMVARRGP